MPDVKPCECLKHKATIEVLNSWLEDHSSDETEIPCVLYALEVIDKLIDDQPEEETLIMSFASSDPCVVSHNFGRAMIMNFELTEWSWVAVDLNICAIVYISHAHPLPELFPLLREEITPLFHQQEGLPFFLLRRDSVACLLEKVRKCVDVG